MQSVKRTIKERSELLNAVSGQKILKKPIITSFQGGNALRAQGENIMQYPNEVTTWSAEIHGQAHRERCLQLAKRERLLRQLKKTRAVTSTKKITRQIAIFLNLFG